MPAREKKLSVAGPSWKFSTPRSQAPSGTRRESIGRVAAVDGSQATVELHRRARRAKPPTVGKFMGLIAGQVADHRPDHRGRRAGPSPAPAATLSQDGAARPDRRNLTRLRRRSRASSAASPNIPTSATARCCSANANCGLVYGGADADHAHIGDLQQNPTIGVHVDIDKLVSRHFAILGATGVGKSSGVAIILQKILETRPNLRIFLVDPHNEYGRCFGDKAQVLNPRNLRLPFWLFNFEETIDAFFGGRPGVEEEVEILADVIPLAKARLSAIPSAGTERSLTKKRDPRDAGFTADTPVPYRIEDLINAARRAHGQAGEPHLARHLSQADRRAFRPSAIIRATPSCSRTPISAATPWRKSSAPVPAAARRQADDHHAARRLPGRGGRFGGVGALPHGLRLRPVERRRGAAAVRLRGGAPLRAGRQEDRLRPDPPRALAHRQGRPQIRRVPRPGDAAPGGDRPDHHLAMLDAVRHAAVQRPRPEPDPLGGVGRGGQPAVVHSLARHPRSVRLRLRRGAADAHALQGIAGRRAAEQRGLRQHPLRRRRHHQPRPAHDGDRALAQRQHEPPRRRRWRTTLRYDAPPLQPAAVPQAAAQPVPCSPRRAAKPCARAC